MLSTDNNYCIATLINWLLVFGGGTGQLVW